MTVLHLRGVLLGTGDDETERDLYVDGDRLTFDPVAGAETVLDGGWLLPGLVDVHNHPGSPKPGQPLDDALLRAESDAQVAGGVLTVRTPGTAARLPSWYGSDEGTPRVQHAGRWVAVEGRFFRGWGRQVPVEAVADAAVDEAVAAGGGWAKLVVDWSDNTGEVQRYTPSMDPATIAEAVRRVHEAGFRVAVHSQCRETAEAAVAAGVDTLEHGMHLPLHLLEQMAAQGTALVPTLLIFSRVPAGLVSNPRPPEMAELLRTGWERMPGLTASAVEAGVTVLAGTDVIPQAHVLDEVRCLVELAGLSTTQALAAASWTARQFLGLPGLEEGGLADVVGYRRDPRTDLSLLPSPDVVVLRGEVTSRR